MKMPKITPGPWSHVVTTDEKVIDYHHIQIGDYQVSTFPYKRIYSDCRQYSAFVKDETKIADTVAMAALPDLLEALIEADLNLKAEGYERDGPTRGPIRDALLKAGCTE